MTTNDLDIRPIAGACGAEIHNVDLTQELGVETVAKIRQALLDYVVIFFRDQNLTPDDQLRFARYFGDLDQYPMVKGMAGYPDIVEVVKHEHERHNFGGLWHSDTTYLDTPPMGSILYARQVPEAGGDTIFANMYLAYDSLSEAYKTMIDGMIGINSSAKADVSKTREDRVADNAPAQSVAPKQSEHPIVRTHPETGRKALYCSAAHTVKIKGFSEAESAPILNHLYQQQTRVEHTCQFRWREGSLAFWDNRAGMHNPINDYHGQKRVMHRITLKGDKPC